MTVLRPNSVSVECSDRQFDCTPQSPHASQTRSSIMTRNVDGSEDAALAIAALLGGALLIVDVHGDAVDRLELLLRIDDRIAVHDVDAGRQIDAAVLRRIVGGDR